MQGRRSGEPGRAGRLLGRLSPRALSAVAAQGVTALVSLGLQVVVGRELGAAALGTFGLLLATLLLLTAVHSGFIGDSLTVLDRHDPRVRGALAWAQVASTLVGAAVASAVALMTGTGHVTAAAFALTAGLWLAKDTCRRLFMARLSFGRLLANDVITGVATLSLLAAWLAVASPSLTAVALAMAVGSGAGVVVALVQLPRTDVPVGRLTREGVRRVMAFAGWRAMQIGIRPVSALVVQSLIGAMAGLAALGAVVAARMLLAPLATVHAGLGSFLLPSYTRDAPGTGSTSPRRLAGLSAVLAGTTLVYSVPAVLLAEPLGRLLVGQGVPVPALAVASWGLSVTAYAALLPVLTATVVRRESRALFGIRLLDIAVGLPAVALVLAAGSPSLAPAGSALGTLVTLALLWRRALRARPTDGAQEAPVEHGEPAVPVAGPATPLGARRLAD